MTAPSAGSTVSGVVTVAANATDDVGVAEVDFLLDGVSIGLDATAPYSVQWNTTTSSNGQHNLSARARDTSGKFGLTSGVVSVTVNNPTTPPLPANLMAGWNFNEGQGTTTTDATGNGNSRLSKTTRSGRPQVRQRYPSRWRRRLLSVLNSPTLNVSGNALTVSTWVNPLGGSGDQVLFGKFWNAGMTSPYYQYGLELQGNGRIPVFLVGTAAGHQAASMGSPLALGQWSHLAVTFDGSVVRFYLDGNLVSSPSIGATTVTPRDTLLYLGSDVRPSQFFNGSLDDLRIYKRTLAQGDIQSDMSTPLAAGSPTRLPPLLRSPSRQTMPRLAVA